MALRALIVEDEEYNREFLKKLLTDFPEFTHILETSDGEEAIALARKHNPDLILLDIQLHSQEMDGLNVAKSIYQFNKEAHMVFVTGYSRYAVDSFEVHPYGYILKPVSVDKFKELIKESVNRIKHQKLLTQDSIIIKARNGALHINKNDIIFIEIKKGICFIHTQNRIFKIRKTLDEIYDLLGTGFLRVHRSYIVNLKKISKTREIYDRSYQVEFWNYPETALMSRYYYPKYKDIFDL